MSIHSGLVHSIPNVIVKQNLSAGESTVNGMAKKNVSPEAVKNMMNCAINSFTSRLGLHVNPSVVDPTGVVSKRLREEASGWNLGGASLEKYEPYVVCSIDLGSGPYGHTSIDTQVHIAKYTLIGLCVDEFEIPVAALEEFMERLYTGSPQLHPLLDYLVITLKQMKLFYSPFLVTQIIRSTVDFINSIVLEEKTKSMTLHSSASSYVKFKRFYNGIGEAYAAFIWDKINFPELNSYLQALPDINIVCDYVNDVFSFYKEELSHETKNFVHDLAIVTNKDVASVLYDVVDETVMSVNNVRQILVGEKEKERWEEFICAYLAFHLETPRYRLHEVVGDEN